MMNRRDFLAASSACVAMGASGLVADDADEPGIIDAHSHIWARDIKSYPLAEGMTLDDLKPPSFTTEELLELTNGRVIASHSNCRALLSGESNPWWQRHISDEVIQEVGRRGGVIGLNLCASFIRHDLDKSKGERPTIARTIDHVGRVCELMGRRTGVGLGSDLDGGFSADWLPEGIRTPSDLTLLTDELKRRGWSDDECAGFAHGNWDRFWGIP